MSFFWSGLQGQRVIGSEAFETFLVCSTWTATTTEPVMLIGKLGEELLRRALRGGVGGSPDLFPLPLEADPIGQIALIDGRHWLLLASVLDVVRLA